MSIQNSKFLREGKTKKLFLLDDGRGMLVFKDDITAFNGARHDIMKDKGYFCAAISAKLFDLLNRNGVRTHFIEFRPPNIHIVKILDMIPLEVVCRNIAFGSFLKRIPIFKPKEELPRPIVEFFLKDDSLNDPFLSEEHVYLLDLLTERELREIKEVTLRVNDILRKYFLDRGLILVDFKLEFGRDENGDLVIGDELSCDSMRIWKLDTGEILDKDLYRMGKSLDEVHRAYKTCYEKIVLG